MKPGWRRCVLDQDDPKLVLLGIPLGKAAASSGHCLLKCQASTTVVNSLRLGYYSLMKDIKPKRTEIGGDNGNM